MKELPYYRHTVAEWMNGDISLENYETKGVFIDVCSWYWFKDCDVTDQMLIKRFANADQLINKLFSLDIIKKNDDETVSIFFLDDQFEKAKRISSVRSKAGKSKKLPKKQLINKSRSNADQMPIYKDKDKEKDKDKDNTIAPIKKSPRKPDLYWDQIVILWGWDPKTKSELSRTGKLTRDFKLKTEDPVSIGKYKNEYQRIHPEWTCSPEAILKNWDELKPKPRRQPKTPILDTPAEAFSADEKRQMRLKREKENEN